MTAVKLRGALFGMADWTRSSGGAELTKCRQGCAAVLVNQCAFSVPSLYGVRVG